jgi:dienelactone hydrolase
MKLTSSGPGPRPWPQFRGAVGLLLLPLLASAIVAITSPSSAQQAPSPRVVDITAPDGVALKATFFAAPKLGPGVLLLHQCNRQRKVWDPLAQSLAASGINVLTLDFRGFGESGGTPFDKLDNETAQKTIDEKWPSDVDAAYDFLAKQPGVDAKRIGAGGASCGVNQSVQLARRHPQVHSLVLLSETTNLAGREFLRKSPQMAMFLAVADDDPDPGVVELMQWLYTLSANPLNEFEHYDKGGHGVEMFTAHPELPGLIVAWGSKELEGGPKSSEAIGAQEISQESHILDLLDQPGGAGAAKVEERLKAGKTRDPKTSWFTEEVVNRIGYDHLQGGDTKGAVAIMKVNVLAYPDSPNVYDSLSDAYLADGQKDLARANAQKAIEMLASDTKDPEDYRKGIQQSAEARLKQLGSASQ